MAQIFGATNKAGADPHEMVTGGPGPGREPVSLVILPDAVAGKPVPLWPSGDYDGSLQHGPDGRAIQLA